MEKTAIFPGSFDPFTLGHKAVVDQGLGLFDRIVVGIGINSEKRGMLTVDNRIKLIRDIYKHDGRVEVVAYEGLTVDFIKSQKTDYVLRGMRNSVDFEFERNMMNINLALLPEMKTVLLFTPPELVAISSSIVREIYSFGGEVSKFMPEGVDISDYL